MSTKRTAADAQIDDDEQINQQNKKNCISDLQGDTAEINNSSDMVRQQVTARKDFRSADPVAHAHGHCRAARSRRVCS